MNIPKKGLYYDKLVWFLILIVFVLFRFTLVIGHEVAYFGFLGMLLFALYIIHNRCRIVFRWTFYYMYMIAFTVFAYLSSLWALQPRYTVGRGNTLLIITFVMFVIMLNVYKGENVRNLLKIAMIGGYIVCLIAILFYGYRNILLAIASSVRLTNGLININDFGMCAAYSLLINMYFIVATKKIGFYTIFSIPAIAILLASESKKAILIIGIGFFLFYILRSQRKGNILKKLLKGIGTIILFALITFFLMQLPALSGIKERFVLMINGFLKGVNSDSSTLARLDLVKIGLQIFSEHKLLGIGINNAQFVVEKIYHRENYYLHNNFIELLADGGIVGFTLYYSIFLYFIIQFWKNRDFSNDEFNICFVLIIVNLVLDYGAVSFLDRGTYFYFLIYYLQVMQMKRNRLYIYL